MFIRRFECTDGQAVPRIGQKLIRKLIRKLIFLQMFLFVYSGLFILEADYYNNVDG